MMINKIIHPVYKNYWLIGQILLVWHHSIKFLKCSQTFLANFGYHYNSRSNLPLNPARKAEFFFLSTDIHVNYLYVYWNSTKETKNYSTTPIIILSEFSSKGFLGAHLRKFVGRGGPVSKGYFLGSISLLQGGGNHPQNSYKQSKDL